MQEINIVRAGTTYNTRMKELMPYEIARCKIAGVVNPIGGAEVVAGVSSWLFRCPSIPRIPCIYGCH